MTFKEDLRARRMAAAADLLAEQRSIPVEEVARLVGYRQGAHFARAFRRSTDGPGLFRECALGGAQGGGRRVGQSAPARED